jgi:hypothetical protein
MDRKLIGRNRGDDAFGLARDDLISPRPDARIAVEELEEEASIEPVARHRYPFCGKDRSEPWRC